MKIAALGECMLEVSGLSGSNLSSSGAGGSKCTLGFGGDTLNMAIYLARAGGEVDYITALGDDHLSDAMLRAWQQEGVGTDLVMRKANNLPGLYMIETDSAGERSFHYWRQNSPARTLLEDWPNLLEELMPYAYFYLSGITLSLYSDAALDQLWQFLDRYRSNHGKVIFDINYRKSSWKNAARTTAIFAAMVRRTDIALSSFDDEKELYGPHSKTQCLERYLKAGATEVVIKDGAKPCLVYCDGKSTEVPIPHEIKPLDTTAAGDSFNGAYLAARLQNKSVQEAVAAGQACAALVIQHWGAIIPREIFYSQQ